MEKGVALSETEIVAGALAAGDEAPVRVWSLIATIYGDCTLPAGGELWLGTLTEILGALGAEPDSVRAAVSRLARQGFLTRRREGRTSHYALSPSGLAQSRAAAARIYAQAPRVPEAWEFVLPEANGPHVRAALEAAGFRAAGGLFCRPDGTGDPPAVPVLSFVAKGDDAALAQRLYDLNAVAARYRGVLKAVDILAAGAGQADGLAALARRVALVHVFRRAVLRDPDLPRAARPPGWPANDARRHFLSLHAALSHAANGWLQERAETVAS